jgi:hypothetical protein
MELEACVLPVMRRHARPFERGVVVGRHDGLPTSAATLREPIADIARRHPEAHVRERIVVRRPASTSQRSDGAGNKKDAHAKHANCPLGAAPKAVKNGNQRHPDRDRNSEHEFESFQEKDWCALSRREVAVGDYGLMTTD